MGASDLDWSALDLSKNPVPGGKSTIDALASQFSENGKRCQEVSHSITSACGKAPDFKGDSAKQLQQSLSKWHSLPDAFQRSTRTSTKY